MILQERPGPENPDINHLYCTLVEQVDDSGRYGLIVYVMKDEDISDETKMEVEMLVNRLLVPHRLTAALAAIAIENISEIPAGEQLIKLEQLPVCLLQ